MKFHQQGYILDFVGRIGLLPNAVMNIGIVQMILASCQVQYLTVQTCRFQVNLHVYGNFAPGTKIFS